MKIWSAVGAIGLCLFATVAFAQEYKAGALEIDHPWSRATPKGAKTAAGYMAIKNTGSDPDRLIGGTMEDASRVEVHEMSMTGGVMKMRPVEGGLEIKPGETVTLKPSGFHVMLVNLKHPLEQGNMVKATLKFEHAGTIDVEYPITALGAAAPGAPPSGGGMMEGHGGMMQMQKH
jgi:periplasmic copper chaperone A